MRLVSRSLAVCGAFLLIGGVTGSAAGGGGGGGAGGGGLPSCVDEMDACQVCAGEECPAQTQTCCDAPGCSELVLCVLDNCASAQDFACIFQNCQMELDAAGGIMGQGTAAAQPLGECLAGPLQNPPMGACTECADGFGGGNPTGGGGMGSTVATTSSGQGGGGGMAAATTGSGTGGATSTGTGMGGANDGNGNDLVVEDGCGCVVVGISPQRDAGWAIALGLAGAAFVRRRRR